MKFIVLENFYETMYRLSIEGKAAPVYPLKVIGVHQIYWCCNGGDLDLDSKEFLDETFWSKLNSWTKQFCS